MVAISDARREMQKITKKMPYNAEKVINKDVLERVLKGLVPCIREHDCTQLELDLLSSGRPKQVKAD